MRIAVVTSYFPMREQPYRGHSAYQTLRCLKNWADLTVYVPTAAYPPFLTPRGFQYFRPDGSYQPPDLAARYFEFPAIPRVSRFLNGHACYRSLLPHLKERPPDLILNYNLYPDGYAAMAAGRVLNVPVVLCAIGSDLCRIQDAPTRWLTHRALQKASFTITVSEELRRRAIALGAEPERVRAIRNGCDGSIFHLRDRAGARAELNLPPEGQVILYVGRLDANKGVRDLLTAFGGVAGEFPRAALVLVGDGVLREEALARVRHAGLQSRVRLAPPCDSAGVARWMAAADVFCLPSYNEGCPNVVIEALACGRPVVASAVGGIPELVNRECGILAPAGEPATLAGALKTALARQWDAQAIAMLNRRPWGEVARETYEICASALGGL